VIDLTGTPVANRLRDRLVQFALGNERTPRSRSWSFNLGTLTLHIEVRSAIARAGAA